MKIPTKYINVSNTKEIYNFLEDSVLNIVSILEKKTDDIELEQSNKKILDIIYKYRHEKLDKAIDGLKQNQEWDRFTIAFYGETNAGKSTIVEALRIYFQEENKIKQQSQYNIVSKEFKIKKDKLSLQLHEIQQEEQKHKKKLDKYLIEFEAEEKMSKIDIDKLTQLDIEKKEHSIIYRMLSFLGLSDTRRQVEHIRKRINDKKNIIKKQTKLLNKIAKKTQTQSAPIQQDLDQLYLEYEQTLKALEDGQIIGDGRSDFTKKMQIYTFKYRDKEFDIIDVPGIEGNESMVVDEILSAVKKAHGVFYVTSSPTPPQKGENEKKGTLEKIKEHLNSQTEVYSIYNKRNNSPEGLSDKLITNNEKESLKILDSKIEEVLGSNYVSHKCISAKVAFLALSKCFMDDSKNYKEQKKFLDKYDKKELLNKTLFTDFCIFIAQDMIQNQNQKIKKSNFNKAYVLSNELSTMIDKAQKEIFEPQYQQIAKATKDTIHNIQNTHNKNKSIINSTIKKLLNDFENTTRKKIYGFIDKNVDDKYVEKKLKIIVKNQIDTIKDNYATSREKNNLTFQKSFEKVLENHNRRVSLIVQDFESFKFSGIDIAFEINLKTDNGISTSGVAYGIAASVIATATALSAAGPVGWTMLGFEIATTGLIMFKSVVNYFDDDYKKSQQREISNENIKKVSDSIKHELSKDIVMLIDGSKQVADSIIDDLNNSTKQAALANKNMKNLHQELVQIEKQIKKEGER